MTDPHSSLVNYSPYEWADLVLFEHSPISFTITPDQYFSPIVGLMPVHHPSARRRALDHLSSRFEQSGLPGSDHAIAYLHEKYTRNLAPATIKQAGSVVYFFLTFLRENKTDIGNVSRQ
ncbi:MAG: hypothetical protein SCH71_12590, partial [Desulfobulbaceae bacterium]|nr:hypothetical protein [Desulfobulbaceae bacterium]